MTATETSPPPPIRNTALLREVGKVGLIWASVGSIIGSGWLFGAQKGLIAAGPAAIISWGIGGVMIMVLALIHAELGGMYPVSGGTARFPHYAFGGAAGASFGWFSWLQAATVAPIEVSAMIEYAGHYSWADGWLSDKGTLTTSGLIVAIILMAILTAVNFLGVKMLAATNSAMTWWKIAVPLLTILVLALFNFHGSNFTAANGFNPNGLHGILLAVATSGIIFSYLGFEQADQLAGEAKNPKKDIPFAIIGSILIGMTVYILLQVAFLVALPADTIGKTWDATGQGLYTTFTGPFAEVATALSLGWLAWIIYVDAIVSPAGTGLIYITGSSRVSYGLSRNGYVPTPFEWTNERRVPWVGLIAAFITGVICFLPFPSWQSLVGLITSASVLMYAGAPLSLGAFRRRLPNADRPYVLPRGRDPRTAGLRHLRPDHPVVGLGHRLEARDRDPDRLRDPGREPDLRPQRQAGAPEPERRGLAAGVPRRDGGHRLLELLRADGRPGAGRLPRDHRHGDLQLRHLLLGDGGRAAGRGDRGDGLRGRPARGGGPGDALPLSIAVVTGLGYTPGPVASQRRVAMITAASLATITSTAVNRGSVSQPSRSTSTRP